MDCGKECGWELECVSGSVSARRVTLWSGLRFKGRRKTSFRKHVFSPSLILQYLDCFFSLAFYVRFHHKLDTSQAPNMIFLRIIVYAPLNVFVLFYAHSFYAGGLGPAEEGLVQMQGRFDE